MKGIKLNKITPYGYLVPIGIILCCFYIIPILMSIVLSFTKYNVVNPPNFVGLSNYKDLLHDEMFKAALKNTLIFTGVSVPIQTILSLGLAVWITSRKSKFHDFIKGVIFIPVISSMMLIGIIWRLFLNGDASPLNMIFTVFRATPPNWLGDSHLALFTLIGINIWKNIGYFVIIYVAGIMDIDRNVYEAAKIDGAGFFTQFKSITIPLLKPINVMVIFLGVIWSFQTFDLVYVLTGGGPGTSTTTLVLYIYNLAFKQFNAGYAMAAANILLLIAAFSTIIQRGLLKKDNFTIY